MKTPKRPVALMTVAQAICLLAVPVTLTVALPPFAYAIVYTIFADYVHFDNTAIVAVMQVLKTIPDLLLCICLVFAEVEAIRICGRVKKTSAFSEINVNGLGRIVKALAIAGVIALVLGDSIIPTLLTGLPPVSPVVERLLLPFMLLVIALMIRTVQVLMRRALTMQEETDLTV